jgi:hypothetical protein
MILVDRLSEGVSCGQERLFQMNFASPLLATLLPRGNHTRCIGGRYITEKSKENRKTEKLVE